MLKKCRAGMIITLLVVVLVMPVHQAAAQGVRSIVPYDRDVVIETVDPTSQTPRNAFCIGTNTIDVKLTNNSGQKKYVAVINRDTEGKERTLFYGWLETGSHYLSALMRMQFNLPGPAGVESLRVVVNEYGQMIPGNAVSFYVQECGYYPPYGGGGYGYYAQIWARVYPFAIEQGKKGTVLLQTNMTSRTNATYYFEILNSWGQLWKRIPVSKRPYERYQVTLPVGENTKPGLLTYTVKLWYEPGSQGERRTIGTTKFSFRVVEKGSRSSSYYPGYPGYPGYSGYSMYPTYPTTTPSWPSYGGTDPYSGMSPYDMQMLPGTTMPYSGSSYPSMMDPYSGMGYPSMMTPYSSYPLGSAAERNIQ